MAEGNGSPLDVDNDKYTDDSDEDLNLLFHRKLHFRNTCKNYIRQAMVQHHNQGNTRACNKHCSITVS